MKPQLITIIGPTASGKTVLSIAIAKHFKCDILNCDSRQFYREMSIGTAKPTVEEMDGVIHHFIDSQSINDHFSAGRYEVAALDKLQEIYQSTDKAVLVGGSGLYIQGIEHGFDSFPDTPEDLRNELQERAKKEGLEVLAEELKALDPISYEAVDLQNSQRLRRALEVCLVSGKPYSSFKNQKQNDRPFEMIKIGIDWEREALYDRINQRVDIMIEQGLVDEVKSLIAFEDRNALQTVGYRELFPYLRNECSLEESIEQIKTNSRRYAKRQMTWFRKDENIHWFKPEKLDQVIPFIESKIHC